MPSIRFSLRWAMGLIGVAAVLIGTGLNLSRRRERSLNLAAYHRAEAGLTGSIMRYSFIDAKAIRRRAYHADLGRKYERAASRPWLPVELDPPEPE